jgi:TatD DNase family protein
MRIYDSHAHYDDERYSEDFSEVLDRNQKVGVEKIMLAATDLDSSKVILDMADKNPVFSASVGIHPENAKLAKPSDLEEIEKLANDKRVKAIGEIGLDYHYGSDKEEQKFYFEKLLDIAEKAEKPVIIHSRDATEDTLNILRKRKVHNGVVHCFSGSKETAMELLKMGYYIGFTGVVTFKNARAAIDNVAAVPLNRLLIETDCPYMAPTPHRGERNESSYLTFIVEKIAEIKNISPEEVAEETFKNAVALFGEGE